MRIRTDSSLFAYIISALLSYTLLISLFAPLMVRRASAAPPEPTETSSGKAASTVAVNNSQAERREGEVLVRFREGIAEADKSALAGSLGARRGRRVRGKSRIERLNLTSGRDPQAVAAELRLNPKVELAEPNFLLHHDELVPDDGRFGEQWALRNTGQGGGLVGSDINAAMAWEKTTGAQSTVIAVIDSGVDFTHPDLALNQWTNPGEVENGRDDDGNGFVDDLHGWDWVSGSNLIHDEQGHGTSVAGAIAAQGNNADGITGVMWRAGLMSLRVLDNTGTGDIATAVEAIDYAIERGAHVINCSWGTNEESLILRDAIERAGRSGVVVVCSAGNSGRDIETAPYYPASFGLPNLVAVASTDGFDRIASFSNHGATHVTVAAPGTDILTTQMGGGYRVVSGTSISAPMVSGVAGLIKTVRPWLSANGTAAAIKDGARRVAELSGQTSTGGIVSASGALEALQGPDTPPPPGDGDDNGGDTTVRSPEQGYGSGGTAPDGGFSTAPPDSTQGTPGAGLPNLDSARNLEPATPKAPPSIHADLLPECMDECGGSYPPLGTGSDPDFATARVDPENETGQAGVDLGSRNFNWGQPLVSLKGRAGLDLSLTLSYNSL
ncbi:MAG TPA: S8 family peptidase, partial [Pyrinomonadaceae bacterium]|nr:S8 family peptidase [Pyrinomonadaceae bacterium]